MEKVQEVQEVTMPDFRLQKLQELSKALEVQIEARVQIRLDEFAGGFREFLQHDSLEIKTNNAFGTTTNALGQSELSLVGQIFDAYVNSLIK